MRSGLLVLGLALLFAAGCDKPATQSLPVSDLQLSADCQPEQGCTAMAEGLTVQVRFDTPARALKPFPISLKIDSDNTVEAVLASFSMRDMDMGLNRYRLGRDANGDWHGTVTLPICVSGRSDWIAAFEMTAAQRRYRLQIPFVLRK
jgi:hypothetical protein